MTPCSWASVALAGLCFHLLVGGAGGAQLYKRSSTADIVRARGFECLEFEVVSQGYPLRVYRVVNPLANASLLHPVPVVASHGITFDMTHMLSGSTNARPRAPKPNERVTLYAPEGGVDDRNVHLYLANNNYDVWLIEARATSGRRARGVAPPVGRDPFWDFSIDEQALFDLPRQLDFVLEQTGAPRVALLLYSQSTTFAFALLAMRPEYEAKVAALVAVAPVVFSDHIKFPSKLIELRQLSSGAPALVHQPEWRIHLMNLVSADLCANFRLVRETLCQRFWDYFGGKGVLAPLEGTLAADAFKTTSLKTFAHFLRNSNLHDFYMWDEQDPERNMLRYGQPRPPLYNVSRIGLKSIVLFRGTQDKLSDFDDQIKLLGRLVTPPYEDHVLPYGHLDFILSTSVVEDVNEPILRALDALTGRRVVRELHTLNESAGAMPEEGVADASQERRRELVRKTIAQSVGNFFQLACGPSDAPSAPPAAGQAQLEALAAALVQ